MGVPLSVVPYEPADIQVEDLATLEELPYSANWSEMGCMKTTTGLWLAERKIKKMECPAVLVITTKMGKGSYFDAVPKAVQHWLFLNAHTNKLTQLYFGKYEENIDSDEFIKLIVSDAPTVVLAHYHCFTNNARMKELLWAIEWDGVIVDEAHRMKDKDSQWTRNIKRLKVNDDGFRHIMTGTGFVNRPDEIWSLLNFLDRKRWGSYWGFRATYCKIEIDEYGYEKVVGVKEDKLEEFRELRRSLGPRRMLSEVRPDIPHPIETSIHVDLNTTQRKMYNEIETSLWTLDQQGVPIHSPNVLSQLNRLRQIAVATPEKYGDKFDPKQGRRVQLIRLIEPSSKLDAVMEILGNLEWDDEAKQKLVVFSQFKDPLALLEARLAKEEIPYLRLLQQQNEEARYKLWHDEWPKPEYRVFLSTLDLGAESINLTGNPENLPADQLEIGQTCQRALFLDRSWSPRANNQAIGRIYRPGQTGQVQLIYVHGRDTIDQRILELNNLKTGWFKDIFND